MTRGAEKYSIDEYIPITKDCLFNKLCDLIGVGTKERKLNVSIKIDLFTANDCVGLVTKNNYEKTTQILLNVKEKIETNGEKKEGIKNGLENQMKKEEQTRIVLNEIKGINDCIHLKLDDLMRKQIFCFINNKKIDVEYVDEILGKSKSILIMTMIRDSQEVIYVVGATTDLDSFETLQNCLSRLYNTLKIHQPIKLLIEDNLLVEFIDGSRNWEKASTPEELSRFKESAIRHFFQWFNGEDVEEDHAAAVFFNISGAEMVKSKLK